MTLSPQSDGHGRWNRRVSPKILLVPFGSMLAVGMEFPYRILALITDLSRGSGPLGLIAFLGVWGALVIATLLVSELPSTLLRCLFAALFFASSIIVHTYFAVMGVPLEVTAFERLLSEMMFAGEAVQHYVGTVAVSAILGMPLAIGIVVPVYSRADRRAARRPGPALAAVVAGLCLIGGIVWSRGGEGTVGLPAQFRPLGYLVAIVADDQLGSGAVARLDVREAPQPMHKPRDIVLVVDESIVSDAFAPSSPIWINPQLGTLGAHAIDFGAAASGANCSTESNWILRVGPRAANLKIDLVSHPPVWAYARRAGFETHYIDMQYSDDVLHNAMTAEERAMIDHVTPAGMVPVYARDRLAGAQLRRLLQNDRSDFVLINKVGAHFPWDSKYPTGEAPYQPTLGVAGNPLLAHLRGQKELLATMGRTAGSPEFRNSYRNAARWAVSSFFDELQVGPWLAESVVLYTSDHGQNVTREGGRSGTHCSIGANAPRSEGRVPLLFFTAHAYWLPRLTQASERNRGRVSHFNLFSTIVGLMGYRVDALTAPRDSPVWGDLSTAGALMFATEVKVRFGRPVAWTELCGPGEAMDLRGSCH